MAAAAAVVPMTASAGLTAGLTSGIGTVGAIFGIISFAETHVEKKDPPASQMRIAVGLNSYSGMDSDGDVPDVRLWDETGSFLGIELGEGHIDEGSFADVVVDQSRMAQPTYAMLSGNRNGICLAYLLQTWPDQQNYAWVGDWGWACDQHWYLSNIILDGVSLKCTWIDYDGKTEGDSTGLSVHFPEFNDKGHGYNEDLNYYCNNKPVMDFRRDKDPNDIRIWTPPLQLDPYSSSDLTDEAEERRSVVRRRRRPRSDDAPLPRLIKSALATHRASDLCKSATSHGPDFVSLAESLFCDMDTRILWPLCKGGEDAECFDNEAHDLRLARRRGKRDGAVLAGAKSYRNVTRWG